MTSIYLAVLLFAVIINLSFAYPVVIDSPPMHPKSWKRLRRSNSQNTVQLTFAIKQQNIKTLEKRLLEVSTPSNPLYGQHLTSTTIHDLLKPKPEAIKAVRDWLHSNGVKTSNIKSLTPNQDFIQISITVAKAEKLLSTTFYDYQNSKFPGMIVIRVNHKEDYAVPETIAKYLDFISPTKRFPSPLTVSVSKRNLRPLDTHASAIKELTLITPTVLHELYKVYNTQGIDSENKQGIASFIGEYYNDGDLETFWDLYSIDDSLSNVERVPSSQESGYGAEAELDVQYITSMGINITTQVRYTGGETDVFLNWLIAVLADEDRPHLISVSYGEYETYVGLAYATRLNVEFMKLGAQGVSILFASGDDGAGEDCTTSNDAECPDYPASSPYVTAVGGLYGGSTSGSTTDETAWSYSGGGFSDYFSRPSWQESAVRSYLEIADLDLSCSWNENGRGYPDISAQSVDFVIEWEGELVAVSGTSCSAPTVGGIFALLNDLRLQNGLSTLGFLNPLIYAIGSEYSDGFNDVIQGSNTGCGGEVYSAVENWDAVTGWGSPNYEKLAIYVLDEDLLMKVEEKKDIINKEEVIIDGEKGHSHHWVLTGLGAVL